MLDKKQTLMTEHQIKKELGAEKQTIKVSDSIIIGETELNEADLEKLLALIED